MDNLNELTNKIANVAGTFGLTREQYMKNLERIRSQNQNQPTSPVNISGSNQPELGNMNIGVSDRAAQNIRSSALSTEEFLRRAQAGEPITSDQLTQIKAEQTKGILDFLKRGEQKEERGRELLEESGISQLREQQAGYANELAAEQRALETERRRLLENPEGVGAAALQGRIAQAERFSLQKQADLAILANASANNIEVARQNIQDRLDIEFGDLDAQLNNYKLQVQAVDGLSNVVKQDLIEQAEQQAAQQQEQRALKEQLLQTAANIAQTNPALAREMVNMTMGEVSYESVQNIQGRAITSGALSDVVGVGDVNDLSGASAQNWPAIQQLLSTVGIDEDGEYKDLGKEGMIDTIRSRREVTLANGDTLQLTDAQVDAVTGKINAQQYSTSFVQNPFGGEGGAVGNLFSNAFGTISSFFR